MNISPCVTQKSGFAGEETCKKIILLPKFRCVSIMMVDIILGN